MSFNTTLIANLVHSPSHTVFPIISIPNFAQVIRLSQCFSVCCRFPFLSLCSSLARARSIFPCFRFLQTSRNCNAVPVSLSSWGKSTDETLFGFFPLFLPPTIAISLFDDESTVLERTQRDEALSRCSRETKGKTGDYFLLLLFHKFTDREGRTNGRKKER